MYCHMYFFIFLLQLPTPLVVHHTHIRFFTISNLSITSTNLLQSPDIYPSQYPTPTARSFGGGRRTPLSIVSDAFLFFSGAVAALLLIWTFSTFSNHQPQPTSNLDPKSPVSVIDNVVMLVTYNRETDQSRGFGFVTMSTVEEADKAVEMLHRYRVYVGNLPWDVDDVGLEQLFSEHGKVVNARVGFVTISSESEVNDAFEDLDAQGRNGKF
ncbi:hypothetical protein LXL04_022435 [Taraxacum kok-saghyz]